MANGTFGEKLRRERELRGVSLEEVSAATRITLRYLLALENEQWNQLPGGVFNRGFVRTVARFLGLNEEEFLADYATATVPSEQSAEPGRTAGRHGAQVVTHPRRASQVTLSKNPDGRIVRLIVLVLMLIALIAGAWYGWKKWKTWRTPSSAPVGKSMGAVPQAAQPAPTGNSIAATPDSKREAEILRLKVETGRPTHMTIIADGRTVLDERVEAGRSLRFDAKEKFEVTARDSTAVLLELNGQTLPPLGVPGEAGRVTLTRNDLKRP